jgi:hypothetical protein
MLVVLAIAAACLAAVASASAAPSFTNRMVTVKITGSQKTTWQASPVADPGCENKPTGSQGSGTETIAWTQARALKGQLTGSGKNWGLMLFDKKNYPTSNMPISVTMDRSGGGHDVVCGKPIEDRSAPCVGHRVFGTDAELAFLTNQRFTIDDRNVSMTTAPGLYPDCDWIWNGMTVRTGAVVLNVGMGKFTPKLLANAKRSVSLRTHEEKRCEDEGADPGVTCNTVTDWRITFYPYKTRSRH